MQLSFESSSSSVQSDYSRRMQEAAREAVCENWLHGIPASTWQEGKIVYVWPSDEEIKKLPCYELIADQVKRELSLPKLPQ